MWRAPITPDAPRHTFNPSADHDFYNKPINPPNQIPETPTQCGGIAPTCTQPPIPIPIPHPDRRRRPTRQRKRQPQSNEPRPHKLKQLLTPNPHTQLPLLPPIPNPPPGQETRLHPNQWLRRHTLPPRRKQTPNPGHRRRWRHGNRNGPPATALG
jgi:hypothetical protein